jgi:hypothetical protein
LSRKWEKLPGDSRGVLSVKFCANQREAGGVEKGLRGYRHKGRSIGGVVERLPRKECLDLKANLLQVVVWIAGQR